MDMKRLWLSASLLIASLGASPLFALATPAPAVEAQRDGNHRGNSSNRGGNGSKNHGSSSARPGSSNGNKNHGSSASRPGSSNGSKDKHQWSGNKHQDKNHGSSTGRPGNKDKNHGSSSARPGHDLNKRPNGGWSHGQSNKHHGSSAARPGAGQHHSHPNWRPLPSRPVRPVHIHHYHPVQPSILGLTLGTIWDLSLSSLRNAGYNVIYSADNILALSNVNQFGVVWPEVHMFYGPYGMSSARFQRFTPSFDPWAWNTSYRQLYSLYGEPESVTKTRTQLSATWWTGGDSYITLTCGPASVGGYATDLIFGN